MSLDPGQVFAGYTIVRLLGAGAMGNVYLASHPRLPRQDALKVLPADLTADPEFRARFLREAELAAALSHPHIVRIHDRGEEDGQFWISMDYVAGTDAGRVLREQYPSGMPVDEVVSIIAAVGSALDYAHYRGLLHRDVKPANILLADPDGQLRRVFLADFGIARRVDDAMGLTATNMTVGTVNYAAPEQLKGLPIDGRADQYALACTAFHLLAGAAPFEDSNPAVVISRHVGEPPPSIGTRRPELAGLDAVFATAMAKEPAERFGNCAQFAEQLGRQLNPGFAYAGQIPPRRGQPDHRAVVGRRDAAHGEVADETATARRAGRCSGGQRTTHRRRCVCGDQAHRAAQAGDRARSGAGCRRRAQSRCAQHGSVHRRVHRRFRPRDKRRRTSTQGCDTDHRNVGCPVGVRKRRVHGDRVTPKRRHRPDHFDGVRPGRRKLGGGERRLNQLRQSRRRGLGNVHAASTSRRHHPGRRSDPDDGRGLCQQKSRDLHPHGRRRRQHTSRPGHPAAAGGIAGRRAPRPLPRNGYHAERLQRGAKLRRPYELPSLWRSVHQPFPRAALVLHGAGIRRRADGPISASPTTGVRRAALRT